MNSQSEAPPFTALVHITISFCCCSRIAHSFHAHFRRMATSSSETPLSGSTLLRRARSRESKTAEGRQLDSRHPLEGMPIYECEKRAGRVCESVQSVVWAMKTAAARDLTDSRGRDSNSVGDEPTLPESSRACEHELASDPDTSCSRQKLCPLSLSRCDAVSQRRETIAKCLQREETRMRSGGYRGRP